MPSDNSSLPAATLHPVIAVSRLDEANEIYADVCFFL